MPLLLLVDSHISKNSKFYFGQMQADRATFPGSADLPLLLAGYNYPENRYLGAFLFSPILLVAESFFMAWLTLRTRSFWPAALAHGAGDSIQGGLSSSIKTTLPGLYMHLTELTLFCV